LKTKTKPKNQTSLSQNTFSGQLFSVLPLEVASSMQLAAKYLHV